MVNVADIVVVFPQASVAVQVTNAEPVAPHPSLSSVKLCVIDTVPQTSSAATSTNQSFRSEIFPEPSHSTVRSWEIIVNSGAVVSSMVNVADVVVVFP